MTLDATKAETDALLDLLDKAQRAGGLNVSYWCLAWAQKVKAAEREAQAKPELVKGSPMLLDAEVLGEGIAGLVRAHVATSIAPLLKRIAELEAREPMRGEKGEPGEPGKNGANGIGYEGKAGADGKDGASGRDGVDGKDGRDGVDGKDAQPESVMVEVARQIALRAPPLNGKDGADGVDGKDGIGERGEKGMDGTAGRDGRDGLPGVQGEKGMDGANGRDGLWLDDFDAELKDGRNLVLRLRNGERMIERELRLGLPLYRGTWKSGGAAQAGDCVTYGGTLWIALRDTNEPPGKSPDWRMAVKSGMPA